MCTTYIVECVLFNLYNVIPHCAQKYVYSIVSKFARTLSGVAILYSNHYFCLFLFIAFLLIAILQTYVFSSITLDIMIKVEITNKIYLLQVHYSKFDKYYYSEYY